MIAEQDIEQLLTEWNSVPAWVKAHVTAKHPAHRYEGELRLDNENLVFAGWDIKEGKQFDLEIPLDGIKDVHVGFSKSMEATTDPAFGIGGAMPFAVRYQDNGMPQTAYFNTCSDKYLPHRHINNVRWCEELDEIIGRRWTEQ